MILLKKSDLKYNLYEIASHRRITLHGKDIVIFSGFLTDLASVPRLLWFLFPPHGYACIPSVIHDYISQLKLFDRKTCDKIFLELLLETKMSRFQAYIMYFFVSIFSRFYYGKIKYKRDDFKN